MKRDISSLSPTSLRLDHLTVIAPTLSEGVAHVRHCLDLDVPFGTRHDYMGTHNHRLQLGNSVYLEIIALDFGGLQADVSPSLRRQLDRIQVGAMVVIAVMMVAVRFAAVVALG